VTVSWPPSTVRRGRSTALAPFVIRCIDLPFRCASACTPARLNWLRTIRGIAVHIASRVAHIGGADDVLVSRTVKDLVAGSGIKFDDFGTHTLKGIPEQWQVYRAIS
jgi:class 3 adenylate cyclase